MTMLYSKCINKKMYVFELNKLTNNITVESGNCSNSVAPGWDVFDFCSEKRCSIKSDDNLDETEIDNNLDLPGV